MSDGFRIAVTFLTNRYHGSEWPCSPSRLFQAIVAGAMNGGNRHQLFRVEPALRWLESQNAPEISVAEAPELQPYRISVPNNDMDIAAKEWAAGRSCDVSQFRTMKSFEPRELSGNGPHIVFHWRQAEPEPEILEGLRIAVESLHTLGWGIDMAFADLRHGNSADAAQITWRPAATGCLRKVPVAGTFDDLESTYKRFLNASTKTGVDADTRASIYRMQPYSRDAAQLEHIAFSISETGPGSDYDEPRSRSFPADNVMAIAAWLRHAAAQVLLEEQFPTDLVNALALGHDETVQNADRLIYLPIPSVGFRYTDGRIRRVLIAARGQSDILTLLRRKLNGRILTDRDSVPVCRLSLPQDLKVTPQYVGSYLEWATTTPVILHGHNASRGVISINKSEKLLAQAFEQAGHDVSHIEDWAFQPAPFWNGTPGARSSMVPRHLARWPRYHVWVRFHSKVEGPVLAGIGRHYGLGVFAGWRDS